MKERPILFSAEMVRAILMGHKTQTRRVIKPQPEHVWGFGVRKSDPEHISAHVRFPGGSQPDPWIHCPYGRPGDRLWVRETWAEAPRGVIYKANFDCSDGFGSEVVDIPTGETIPLRWKPSIHMPRAASRITLEIVKVRVERLRDISEADAEAEGIHLLGLPEDERYNHPRKHIVAFREIWDMLNASRGHGWDRNPWVWVIEFKTVL